MQKRTLWLIGGAGALVLLGIIVFRSTISGLLQIGERTPTSNQQSVINGAQPAVSTSSGSGGTSTSTQARLPVYQGRDALEVRPQPKETKLFTKAQLDAITADIRKYGSLVKDIPDYEGGWIQVGILKKTIGDYEGARDAWEYAALIRPNDHVPFLDLGDLYTHYLPDYPRAETNFETAMRNKPDYGTAYLGLVELYTFYYKEKEPLADDVLKDGIAKNPKDVSLLKELARVYDRRGDAANAEITWREVLEKEPNSIEAKDALEELAKKKTR